MLNNEFDEDSDEEFLYMEKGDEIIVIKAPINDSLLSLEEDFGQYDWEVYQSIAYAKFCVTQGDSN